MFVQRDIRFYYSISNLPTAHFAYLSHPSSPFSK